MNQPAALLLLKMNSPTGNSGEWNHWFDDIHAKEWMSCPGIKAIRRFELTPGMPEGWDVPAPTHLIVYELNSLDVITSKEYAALVKTVPLCPPEMSKLESSDTLNLTGGVFQQIIPDSEVYEIPAEASYLLAVGHAGIPIEVEEEYHAWYNTEHIPAYLEIPGFLSARRFRRIVQHTPVSGLNVIGADYIALYDLSNNRVFDSAEFKVRGVTPWSTRIRSYTWQRRQMTNIYKSMLKAVEDENNGKDMYAGK